MCTVMRMPFVAAVLLAFVQCDQPAAPVQPVPPQVTDKTTLSGSDSIAAVPKFEFESDSAFAAFARSLEPSQLKLEAKGYVNADHIASHGTRVIGTRNWNSNYAIWSIDPMAARIDSQAVDATREDEEEQPGFSSATWKSNVARDGSWGFFVWPNGEDQMRGELWRLPADAREKPHRFHAFDSQPSRSFDRATISNDGRWLLCTVAGQPTLVSVDAVTGKVKEFSLVLPEELKPGPTQRVFLKLAGHGLKVSVERTQGIDKAGGGISHQVAVATFAIDAAKSTAGLSHLHWLEGDEKNARGITAMSPDGRLMFVQNFNSLAKAPSTLWRLHDQPGEPPSLLATLPQTATSSTQRVAWSGDGSKMALSISGTIHAFHTRDLEKAEPFLTVPTNWLAEAICFSRDGSQIHTVSSNGYHITVPLDQPRQVQATIGQTQITWEVPLDAPDHTKWPVLRHTGQIRQTQDGRPVLMTQVFNEGQGSAQQVRIALTVAPPVAPAGGPLARTAPTTELGLLHMGTIRQGESLERSLDLPHDPSLLTKARRFSLNLRSKYNFDPAPIHWLHLPRTIQNEEAYHQQARQIFDAASDILVKARGINWETPRFEAMGPSGYGFMVGYPRTVRYQNAFQMNETALRINRAVMQVNTHDDLMRHAQMMLFWYIPHELVHCGDHRTGWATEFVANMIQPYLTARMLEAMPDAPYTAESMSYIYDRYVEKLAPHLTPAEIASVERFIQASGEGPGPWAMSAPDLFRTNTPAYVYFGARINQHSWAKQSRLEDLCKQYLSSKEPAAVD